MEGVSTKLEVTKGTHTGTTKGGRVIAPEKNGMLYFALDYFLGCDFTMNR